MLSTDALALLRTYLMGKLSYAAYVVDGTEFTTAIQSTVLQDDGRIEATFIIDHAVDETITVTEVRLYDQSNVLMASKAETISQNPGEESILYSFQFTITEPA